MSGAFVCLKLSEWKRSLRSFLLFLSSIFYEKSPKLQQFTIVKRG
jgi:hypothetical protein